MIVNKCDSCSGNNPHYESTFNFPVYCTILKRHINRDEIRKMHNEKKSCESYKDGTEIRRVIMVEVPCPKCGKIHKFEDAQWQSYCDCGKVVWTTNTSCFFCGKITTDMKQECDNPKCLDEYHKFQKEMEN